MKLAITAICSLLVFGTNADPKLLPRAVAHLPANNGDEVIRMAVNGRPVAFTNVEGVGGNNAGQSEPSFSRSSWSFNRGFSFNDGTNQPRREWTSYSVNNDGAPNEIPSELAPWLVPAQSSQPAATGQQVPIAFSGDGFFQNPFFNQMPQQNQLFPVQQPQQQQQRAPIPTFLNAASQQSSPLPAFNPPPQQQQFLPYVKFSPFGQRVAQQRQQPQQQPFAVPATGNSHGVQSSLPYLRPPTNSMPFSFNGNQSKFIIYLFSTQVLTLKNWFVIFFQISQIHSFLIEKQEIATL